MVCSRDGLPYSSLSLETVSSLMPIFMVESQESGEQCIAGWHLLKSWERCNFFHLKENRDVIGYINLCLRGGGDWRAGVWVGCCLFIAVGF